MAKNPSSASARQSAPLPDAIKDSAHEIWLAGLAAFSKAQQEGGKVFEALVQEGLAIQRRTQATAEERMAEATQKMSSFANEFSSRASGKLGKLEDIFEDRVARALKGMGVPTAKEVQALADRLAALEKMAATRKPATKAAPARKRPPARKTS
jgi:poly(hydroxyalkanoate) granule-associated protein